MSSILVPIDFSDNSSVALKYALLIGKELKLKVQLLHVIDMPNFERFLSAEVVSGLSKENIIKRFKSLVEDDILSELKEASNVPLEYLVRSGNVTHEIIEATKQIKPTVVVMGQNGNGARKWDGFWVGGTTQRVIRKAEQPILIVPISTTFQKLNHIAFATDFKIDDFDIIQYLLELTNGTNTKITAVHIAKPKEKVNNKALLNLKNNFSEYVEKGAFNVELYKANSISEGLNNFVKENNVSMMAVLRENTNFIDRVLNGGDSITISMNAEIPTLIFREL